MKWLPFAILPLLFLFVGFYREDTDFYWSKWMVIVYSGSAVIGYRLAKRLHWSVGLMFGLALISSARVYMSHLVPVTNYDASVISRFEASTAITAASLIIGYMLLTGIYVTKEILTYSLWLTCYVDSIYVFYQFFTGPRYAGSIGAFFDYDAMNGCYLAITLPFLLCQDTKRYRWRFLFPAFAIVATLYVDHSSTVFGVLCVTGLAYAWAKCWEVPAFLRMLVLCILALGALALELVINPNLFHNSGRFEVYSTMMKWWWENCNHWLGTGNGTFIHFGPHIQQLTGIQPTQWFLWMHSDWLQILFEMGYLGLGASLLLLASLMYYSFNRPYLFASVMGYASYMAFQFPIHLALPAMTGLSIIVLTLHPSIRDKELSCD